MIPSVRALIATSRPLLWLNTAVLWIIALLILDRRPGPEDLLMILYFTLPFNLWLHGINDVFDYESDRRNVRKGGAEGALRPPDEHAALLRLVVAINVPFWLGALWLGPPLAVAALTLFLFLGWAYSAPPLRGKSRPYVDNLINIAYLMPFLIALAWHGASAALLQAALPGLVAFAAWSMASHAFTSIQDIDADRGAGVRTIATRLGAGRTAAYALGLYGVAVAGAGAYGLPWPLLVGLYPLGVVLYLIRPSRAWAHGLYRLFILLNSLLGFGLTVRLALGDRAHTLWAATLLLLLVAAVALAIRLARPTRSPPDPLPQPS